jgi:hypothetical protein
VKTADTLARQHTERAVETIAEVMNDPFAENKDRLKAAEAILDRGHGKPNQAIIAIPGNRQIAALLGGKSDDELMALINGAALPRLAPIDASYTEVADLYTDPLLE